ncbi:MAG: Holliday junction branch migration protein RuvA, partial [Rhodospirillaceae bacterium]|nr:Holliday junction branch migration protein RuvA [Rhodospirillaceae bacterium]
MIGHLKGTLVAKQPPGLTLDVAGVGYEIEAPMSTFYRLPETGEQLTLLTHFLVRDDAQLLYGFATEAERSLFRNLLKVSGVGARIALGILSGISAEGFRRSVFERDLVTLTRIPGIGRKTAERLILEMTDRLEPPGTDAPETVEGATQAEGEARSALLALG